MNNASNTVRRTIWAIILFGGPTGAIIVMLF